MGRSPSRGSTPRLWSRSRRTASPRSTAGSRACRPLVNAFASFVTENWGMTTVLVVDDEPIVREVVVRYLKREGYRTLEADDGDTARALLRRHDPSLVVLD